MLFICAISSDSLSSSSALTTRAFIFAHFHMSFTFINSLIKEFIFTVLVLQAGKRVGKTLHAPLMELLQKEESLGKKRQKVGFLG